MTTKNNEDGYDPKDSLFLIEQQLRKSIPLDSSVLKKIEEETANYSGAEAEDYIAKYLSSGKDEQSTNKKNIKTNKKTEKNISSLSETIDREKVIMSLFDLYDSLIYIFKTINEDNDFTRIISKNIWRTEELIRMVGGDVEIFIPEENISGLDAPVDLESAILVVNNTKKYYKAGSVFGEKISEDGSKIEIAFAGESKAGIKYTATGNISVKGRGWVGNEAIDYVYTENGGKMMVRAYEKQNGISSWKNVSAEYKIEWDIEEQSAEESIEETTKEKNKIEEHAENTLDFQIVEKN